MKIEYNRPRIDSKKKDEIIKELKRVHGLLGGRYYTRHEFDKFSVYCKGSTVINYFGSWSHAFREAGIQSEPTRKTRRDKITETELLQELYRIWRIFGHRPSKDEWDVSDARYSYSTYKQAFGSWTNACKKVIEHGTQKYEEIKAGLEQNKEAKGDRDIVIIRQEQKRNIPKKLHLKVWQRDNHKCRICGRSPAINPETVLHIDHIMPFSKGGKTELENLRTLCAECDRGKGNDDTF